MNVSVQRHGEVAVVTVSGNIDANTAPGLASALSEEIRRGGTRMVADLTAVEYTSSAGLRALLGALKEARAQGGDFRLAGARPVVHRVLELAGFTSILKHFPDVQGAIGSFAS